MEVLSCAIKKQESYRPGKPAFTKKEFSKLLGVIDVLEDELLFKQAATTGIWRGDICNIKNNHIHLNENILYFYEAKKKSMYDAPLLDDIVLLIRKVWNSREKNKEEFLFPFTGRTAYNRFQVYCEHAGIHKRPFHALRATA
ncbi:tyrosine-type recombinase/integrase [Methanosarcina horonobensis]|uniref:tyrosine-type recombinase/integrase n=1 Tax=Methanosarcina horonobensis TaxID=418008 RepID=UPI000AB40218|nr:tyrosine-type recombinase/integrase [Methanosarcina horonobensis]